MTVSNPRTPTPALRRVLTRRLATQRLTSAPLRRAAEVVRLLGCVQSQERISAGWSLGIRTLRATASSVDDEISSGAIIRTHILRPTWHFVAPDDLRWMLARTSPKVEQGMGARHRQLAIDPRTVDRGLEALGGILAGRTFRSRRQLGPAMTAHGIRSGEQLGHLLMIGELRGLICSGPLEGSQHTYALVDEWIPPTPILENDEATARMVHRFFAGHGPASLADLTRWCTLTQADARRGFDVLGAEPQLGALERTVVDDTELWFDPTVPARTTRRPEALLLPVFDEITLTYRHQNFPRPADHPFAAMAAPGMSDLLSGSILVDARDIGVHSRTVGPRSVSIRLRFAPSATASDRQRAHSGAHDLAAFHSRPAEIIEQDG